MERKKSCRVSFEDSLWVSRGTRADWPYFARWHYRGEQAPSTTDQTFILWKDKQPIGIAVFGFAGLEIAQRNKIFTLPKEKTERYKTINRNFRVVSRFVIDPRYRGAGIAADFLKKCCQQVKTPYIELISVMAGAVPFAEKAGFTRIGRSKSKIGQKLKKDEHRLSGGVARPYYYILDNRKGTAR